MKKIISYLVLFSSLHGISYAQPTKPNIGNPNTAATGANIPILHNIEEKLTVSIPSKDGQVHYFQLPKLSIVCATKKTCDQIAQLQPVVLDKVHLLMRKQPYEALLNPVYEGQLRGLLKQTIAESIGLPPTSGEIKAVLLPASFLVQ